MTPLAALLILDQLPKVEAKIEALNRNYAILEGKLGLWSSCVEYQPSGWIQVNFPAFASHLVSPRSATLAPAFSFNSLGEITTAWSRSKGTENRWPISVHFEKVLRREGGEVGLVRWQGGVRVHELPPALELCREQGEASH